MECSSPHHLRFSAETELKEYMKYQHSENVEEIYVCRYVLYAFVASNRSNFLGDVAVAV
jgi:hypothetical protein